MKKTIIAVDDDPITLGLIKQQLSASFDVNCCDSAEAAHKVIQRKTPELLIMDIHLGDANGIQVVEKLKAEKVSFPIPVLFISSDAKQSNIDKISSLHNGHFLNKVKLSELSARVGELLNVRAALRPVSQARGQTARDGFMADAKEASAQIKSSIEKLLRQIDDYKS